MGRDPNWKIPIRFFYFFETFSKQSTLASIEDPVIGTVALILKQPVCLSQVLTMFVENWSCLNSVLMIFELVKIMHNVNTSYVFSQQGMQY